MDPIFSDIFRYSSLIKHEGQEIAETDFYAWHVDPFFALLSFGLPRFIIIRLSNNWLIFYN